MSTFCTHSTRVKSLGGDAWAVPLRCGCWSCAHCVHRNRRRLTDKIADNAPEFMGTVTIPLGAFPTPGEAVTALSASLGAFYRQEAKRRGVEAPQWIWVSELQQNGSAHLHFFWRDMYVDVTRFRDYFSRRYGTRQVRFDGIRHKRGAASYAAKYAGKQEARNGTYKRHSCSRKWDKRRVLCADGKYRLIEPNKRPKVFYDQEFNDYGHTPLDYEAKWIRDGRLPVKEAGGVVRRGPWAVEPQEREERKWA